MKPVSKSEILLVFSPKEIDLTLLMKSITAHTSWPRGALVMAGSTENFFFLFFKYGRTEYLGF